ncbi:MAG: hypothetical protein PHU23_01865 [Dehalococcoidales bacterium]|nr:hypothetical protein [Dehalococcoidales bacterium]
MTRTWSADLPGYRAEFTADSLSVESAFRLISDVPLSARKYLGQSEEYFFRGGNSELAGPYLP